MIRKCHPASRKRKEDKKLTINRRWAVATCFESPPVLIDMTPGKTKQYNLPQAPKRSDAEIAEMTEKQLAAGAKIQTTAAIFTHDGQHILTGTNKGYINIIRVFDRAMLYSTKISSSAILSLRLSSSGRSLVLNSGDRIIRTLLLPELKADTDTDKIHLTPSHKFSDVVNRLSWNHVCFSPSPTSYVLASTYNNHDVYIWERSKGSLVRILEGPKEECGSVEWCEGRVLVAASGLESGRIHLWGVVLPQRWSALAPDFGELEENVEYEEGEDEFDYVPEEEERRRVLEREDEDVDVLSGGKGVNENGWRFKVLLERDLGEESDDEFVMVGAGTMRRKSPGAGQMKTEGEAEGTPGSGTETETGSGVDKKRKGGRGRKR